MNSLEQLIRHALNKQENPSLETRLRIYKSARAALERTLTSREQVTAEQAAQSQARLTQLIESIEQEYASIGAEPAAVMPADIINEQPIEAALQTSTPPASGTADFGAANEELRAVPSGGVGANPAPQIEVGGKPQSTNQPANTGDDLKQIEEKPSRNYFSLGLSGIILIGFFVLSAWWLANNGLLESNNSNASANAPSTTNRGSSNRNTQGDERDWITVLAPTDIDKLVASAGNRAKLVTELDQPMLELTFGLDREPNGDFQLQVGRGVLAAFAGKKIMIDIALSGKDRSVPISVTCDFGTLGDCGRKRYSVPVQPDSLVFTVDLPAAEPSGSGTIKISGQNDEVMGATIALHGLYVAVMPN